MDCQKFQDRSCSGCDLLDVSYQQSLIIKKGKIEELFGRQIEIIGSRKSELYRNKAKFQPFITQKNLIDLGVIQYLNKNKIYCSSLLECPAHEDGINLLARDILDLIIQLKLPIYDLLTRKGELKYIIIFKSPSNQYVVRFVLRSIESISIIKKIWNELKSDNKVVVCSVNIQPIPHQVLEGPEEILISENQYIKCSLDHIDFYLQARGFFQVNSPVASSLYQFANTFFKEKKLKSLIDLYCGAGGFSFALGNVFENVFSVEINSESIEAMNFSINQKNISNIIPICSPVEKWITSFNQTVDAVVINPPRRGMDVGTIKLLIDIGPEFIFYSSCNPESQKRDIDQLTSIYQIELIQAFDMFVWSKHVENVVILKKIESL